MGGKAFSCLEFLAGAFVCTSSKLTFCRELIITSIFRHVGFTFCITYSGYVSINTSPKWKLGAINSTLFARYIAPALSKWFLALFPFEITLKEKRKFPRNIVPHPLYFIFLDGPMIFLFMSSFRFIVMEFWKYECRCSHKRQTKFFSWKEILMRNEFMTAVIFYVNPIYLFFKFRNDV